MPDLFGAAVSPMDVEEWQAATGITPDLCMIFENWDRQRALTDVCAKARSLGHRAIAVTWEPWTPTPVGVTAETQGAPQREWDAASICAGVHDGYIDAVARSLRDSKLDVYLRFAHEMNGNWYPWSADPVGYVAAWKYVRNRMRSVRAAWNVRFVWSPNLDLWRGSPADWLARLMPYWPGAATVDFFGATMIDFGGDRIYTVAEFAERLDLCGLIFGKPLLAMETNVAREDADWWLGDLASYLRHEHPLRLLVWSQGTSRGAAAGGTGTLGWDVADDPAALAQLANVAAVLRRP